MWTFVRVCGEAERLELWLSGAGDPDPELRSLGTVAARCREFALETPEPAGMAVGRAKVLAAVGACSRAAARGYGGRVRGAAVSLAALAGGGLLVAAAATGGDPVHLVRDTLERLPIFAPARPPAGEVTVEGIVIVVRDEGAAFDLLTEGGTIEVSTSGATVWEAVSAAGLAEGAALRVRGTRSGSTAIAAQRVALISIPSGTGRQRQSEDATAAARQQPAAGRTPSPATREGTLDSSPTPPPRREPTPVPTRSSAATPSATRPPPTPDLSNPDRPGRSLSPERVASGSGGSRAETADPAVASRASPDVMGAR
jgi:hypothetical protein